MCVSGNEVFSLSHPKFVISRHTSKPDQTAHYPQPCVHSVSEVPDEADKEHKV